MTLKTLWSTLIVLTSQSSFVLADSGLKTVEMMQTAQIQQIRTWQRLGNLTPEEVARLERQQQQITNMKTTFMADGLSAQELQLLIDSLEQADELIRDLITNSITVQAPTAPSNPPTTSPTPPNRPPVVVPPPSNPQGGVTVRERPRAPTVTRDHRTPLPIFGSAPNVRDHR